MCWLSTKNGFLCNYISNLQANQEQFLSGACMHDTNMYFISFSVQWRPWEMLLKKKEQAMVSVYLFTFNHLGIDSKDQKSSLLDNSNKSLWIKMQCVQLDHALHTSEIAIKTFREHKREWWWCFGQYALLYPNIKFLLWLRANLGQHNLPTSPFLGGMVRPVHAWVIV